MATLKTDRYRVPLCGGCHHPAGQHPGHQCALCDCKDYLDGGSWGWWSDEQTERLLAAHRDGPEEAT